jgi:hypothetical protein
VLPAVRYLLECIHTRDAALQDAERRHAIFLDSFLRMKDELENFRGRLWHLRGQC